jgi:hypothetical protein
VLQPIVQQPTQSGGHEATRPPLTVNAGERVREAARGGIIHTQKLWAGLKEEEEEGGAPSRLIKTDAGDRRQEGTS